MIRNHMRDLDAAAGRAISTLRPSNQHVEVAQTVLYFLARASACHWGAYWTLDAVPRRLRPIAIWSASSLQAQLLGCDLRRRPLSISLANAREVWRCGKVLWSTYPVLNVGVRQMRPVAEAGLQAGVWFAVQTGSAVYGVIELRGRAAHSRAPDNLIALQRLGFRLGSAIEEFVRAPAVLH